MLQTRVRENLDKGRITGSAPPPPKKLPLPLNGGRSQAFSFLDLGRSGSVNKSLQHCQQNVALLLPHVEQLWQVQIILYALRWIGRCRAPELSFPVEGSGPHAMQRL